MKCQLLANDVKDAGGIGGPNLFIQLWKPVQSASSMVSEFDFESLLPAVLARL